MYEIELRRIDGETVVTFPESLVERVSWAEGDVLYLFERDGKLILLRARNLRAVSVLCPEPMAAETGNAYVGRVRCPTASGIAFGAA